MTTTITVTTTGQGSGAGDVVTNSLLLQISFVLLRDLEALDT